MSSAHLLKLLRSTQYPPTVSPCAATTDSPVLTESLEVLPGLKASQYDIIIMGEHTLFWLKEGGGIRTQKRLDFNPVAILPYTTGTSEQQNLLVATDQVCARGFLRVFWSAELECR